MNSIDKAAVWLVGLILGFVLLLGLILSIFNEERWELIAKHQQNIETIEVLEKRIEVIEEQLEFTYWLLPDGKKNEKQTNRKGE